MHKGFLKLGLGIIILVFAAITAVLLYPNYKTQRAEQEKTAIAEKSSELERLVSSRERDCDKVISLAKDFLGSHKNAESIWSLKGICEYDNGEFDAARISFQKVLALDPGHEPAKSYLARLDFKPGEVVIASRELPADRETFESRIGLALSGLELEKAVSRPANIPEYLAATYKSPSSYSETAAYLKAQLETAKLNYSQSETAERTVFLVFDLPRTQKFFTVSKDTDSARVEIKYLRLE